MKLPYVDLPARSPETDKVRHLWYERQSRGMSLRGFSAFLAGRLPAEDAAQRLGISKEELERTHRPCEFHHVHDRLVPFFDCTSSG